MPGWDEHPRAGHPNGDPFEMPADLAAVQADDALLDMIGAGHAPSDAADELTRVLAAWRHEVHAEPVKELVDTSTALALIRAAARRPALRRRNPVFGSIAGAAAVVVIAFSSVGLVAKSAEPGDPLWGVTQVLYSEYAASVETAAAVRTELKEANKAFEQGRPQQAREALQRIRQQLPAVGESEGRTELTTAQQKLEQQLNPTPSSGSMNPPVPRGFTPPIPDGAGAEDGKPDQNEVRSPEGPTTSPDSGTDRPDMPSATSPSDQFWPDPRDPRSYYNPYPGPAGPERGARDPRELRPPAEKDPAEKARSADATDDRRSGAQTSDGTKPGDTAPTPTPAPPPSPSPSPPPGSGSSIGAGPGTGHWGNPGPGHWGNPSPRSTDIPVVNLPTSEGATVTEAVQPPFSASTASV